MGSVEMRGAGLVLLFKVNSVFISWFPNNVNTGDGYFELSSSPNIFKCVSLRS